MSKIVEEIGAVTKKVHNAVETTEKIIVPMKESLFHRFPILVTLLVTFGFTATLYGIEGIIDSIPFLANHPIAIFLVGISALMIIGKLYQKLG